MYIAIIMEITMPMSMNVIIVCMLELPMVLDSAIDLLIKPLDFNSMIVNILSMSPFNLVMVW